MSRAAIIKRAKIRRGRRLDWKNWEYIQHQGIMAIGDAIFKQYDDFLRKEIAQAFQIPRWLLFGKTITPEQRNDYLKALYGSCP